MATESISFTPTSVNIGLQQHRVMPTNHEMIPKEVGALDAEGRTARMLLYLVEETDYTQNENIKTFPTTRSKRVHCVTAFRMGSSNSRINLAPAHLLHS
jgi:hypothetical protein